MERLKRGGPPLDPAATQLSFAISALHTTTELLKQAILDVAAHPELIEPLREEIKAVVNERGWTTAGLFKMRLLDSVVKETQRLKPGSLVNLERKLLKDMVLPNGITLPRGTNIAVDSLSMWDPSIYPNPEIYDAYRFLQLREAGDNSAVLAATSPEHIAFGIRKPVCPGRFFAANEVRVALARIVLDYDIRLADGERERKPVEFGFEVLSNLEAQLQVRRRSYS